MPVQEMLLLLLLLLEVEGARDALLPPARIGVIGAGIGGTSAAYFLRQKFGREVHIDVFERGEVGGRMATLKVDGEDFETGGVLIFPQNLHMMRFIQDLGLSTIPREFSPVGIYNGEEFVFTESGSKIWDLIRRFWKYGLNPLLMKILEKIGKNSIMRIYDYQDQDQTFSSYEDLFSALGQGVFVPLLNLTTWQAMRIVGFSPNFIAEMVAPIARLDYAQGANASIAIGLITSIGFGSKAQSVEGGNQQVCRGLLSASEARLVLGTVLSVEEKAQPKGHSEKQYEVTFYSGSGLDSEIYDIVLIAAPLQPEMANISFLNFNPPIPEVFRPYFKIVVTFVCGRINATFFGYGDPSQFKLNTILTMDHSQLFIYSIFTVTSVKGSAPLDPPVWKVFSPKPLTEEQLDLLFSSYDTVEEKRWWGWPEYFPPIKFPPIILHDHLYYLNGAEVLASAMEMSAVAAKNAALLAHRRWYGTRDEELPERPKTEL